MRPHGETLIGRLQVARELAQELEVVLHRAKVGGERKDIRARLRAAARAAKSQAELIEWAISSLRADPPAVDPVADEVAAMRAWAKDHAAAAPPPTPEQWARIEATFKSLRKPPSKGSG